MEQDLVHVEYKADVAAQTLDMDNKKKRVTGVLDRGGVIGLTPIKTLERMDLLGMIRYPRA